MLSFDSPYNGKITQIQRDDGTLITLTDASYNGSVSESINSDFVKEFILSSKDNRIKMLLKSQAPLFVIASKTTDGFGLRIRIKNHSNTQSNSTVLDTFDNNNFDELKTKNEVKIPNSYFIIIAILFLVVFILFLIKKRLNSKNFTKSWLFGNINVQTTNTKVIFQKQIDTQNRLFLLEFEDRQYLILSGPSNLLLDKFDISSNESAPEVKPTKMSKDDLFKAELDKNREKLTKYTQNDEDLVYDSYKDRVSSE
jgi:hypothetical protein